MRRKRNTDGDTDPVFDNPILPVYEPKFPQWSSLSCSELETWIKKIEETLMVSKFSDPAEYEQYKLALETAKKFYSQPECMFSSLPKDLPNDSSSLPPLVTPTPANGGGGGTDEKKPYSWLWLVFVAAGVFVLTRKSE